MKFLLYITATLLILPAYVQAEWEEINEGTRYITYIDPESLEMNSDGNFIWALFDFRERQREGYHSAKVLFQVDCANQKYKVLSANTFAEPMADGRSGAPKRSEVWEPAVPNSIGEHATSYVCSD